MTTYTVINREENVMFSTRIITCALAAAGVLLIGSQAIAQGPPGGLNANIVNTPLPVTVTRGTPVAFSLCNSPVCVALANHYSVSVGQRLIIEYASGLCSGIPILQVTTNGLGHSYVLSPSFVDRSTNPVAIFVGSLVKIYADAGSSVMGPGDVQCDLTLSGQLVTP